MPNISIIPAALRHGPHIVEFNYAMAMETEHKQLSREVLAAGVDQVLRDPKLGRYLIAESNGRTVGQLMITYEWSDWRNRMFWWIQSVYVIPELRGAGVYRALHEHVVQSAKAAGGVGGIRLYVDKHNTRAQEVYRRMHMTETNYAMFEEDWSS